MQQSGLQDQRIGSIVQPRSRYPRSLWKPAASLPSCGWTPASVRAA